MLYIKSENKEDMCIPWSGIASSYNDDSIGTEISKIAFLKLMRFALEL